MNWQTVKIGELTNLISSGATPLGGSDNYMPAGPVMFIRSQNVQMNELSLNDVAYVTDEIHQSMKRSWVFPGDVLLNITGASIGRVAWFELSDVTANVNQHVCIIRPQPNLLYHRYLSYFISTPQFQNHIAEMQHGGTRQALTFSQIADFNIPLPPLAEQKRIARILDVAAAVQAQRRATLTHLDTLLQSTFLHMFGDPVTNPRNWKVVSLGEVISDIRYGTGSPPVYISEGYPFIRATNIKMGGIVQNDLKFISVEEATKISKCKIKEGDLIIVRSGVNSGDCALIPKQYDGAYAGYDLIIELPYDWAVFVNHFVNSPQGQFLIKPLTRRAGQPHLNADQVKSIPIIHPSKELLVKFRDYWHRVENMKRDYEKHLSMLDNLFASLQQRAFRGQLSPSP